MALILSGVYIIEQCLVFMFVFRSVPEILMAFLELIRLLLIVFFFLKFPLYLQLDGFRISFAERTSEVSESKDGHEQKSQEMRSHALYDQQNPFQI